VVRLCEATRVSRKLLPSEEERERFIADAHSALAGYFRLEDPRRLDARGAEWSVEAECRPGCGCVGTSTGWDVSAAG